MPKSILVDPREVRKPGALKIPAIPLNRYQGDPAVEEETYGREALRNVYLDMLLIREFETMLDSIKVRGEYAGTEYNHRGPAHLSIGQEAAAVGQCLCLGPEDFIFGSHRSHGEILAKCFSALRRFEEAPLVEIMRGWLGGDTLKVVEKNHPGPAHELAVDFVLYGVLAEIFGRRTGFNRGLGGSMHAFFAPFGSMPNNAIVGGSADIAVGAALFKRINRRPGIVIANIGDGSSGCGPVWEALMMAAMEQYRRLWPREAGGAPPILFNFFNNFYGMGGQPEGETMGFKVLARLAAGVNEEAMHAERVDGTNPLAVADAVARKRELLAAGRGPVLLDTLTYRISGHSPSDASAYRTKEEIALWEKEDCVAAYGRYLVGNGHADTAELECFELKAKEKIARILALAVSPELSPRLSTAVDAIGGLMFSNRRSPTPAPGEAEVLLPLKENPRLLANRRKSRSAFDEEGRSLPKARVISYRDALFEALLEAFYSDPTLAAWGEENREWGGAFGVYRGLAEALPCHRLFNTPISEAAIVGSAVGYALSGGRVVAELMYCDFLGRAGDEVFNQMAKWQSMSAGTLTLPMVLRVSVGSKYGAQHSQDWTALVAHIPGLKIMFPATPYDAKGMLTGALRGSDPVVFFESQRLYDMGEIFVPGGVPEESYEIAEGEPALRRRGEDLTLITVGAALYRALEAADKLAEGFGLSAEVIDLRYLNPLSYEPLLKSVRKTGKVVLISDACERGSFLNTVAAQICQLAFDALDGPPVVLGSRNTITPCAEMEDGFFPQPDWILDAIHERLLPLPGHTPEAGRARSNQSVREMLRRNRSGV